MDVPEGIFAGHYSPDSGEKLAQVIAMRRVAQLICLLIFSSMVTGCTWWEEEVEVEVAGGSFDFG